MIEIQTDERNFFVPKLDDATGESLRDEVVRLLTENGYGVDPDERIFRITWRHDGKVEEAEVGQIQSRIQQRVLLILQGVRHDIYYACTERRGISANTAVPIHIGRHAVIRIVDFADSPRSSR